MNYYDKATQNLSDMERFLVSYDYQKVCKKKEVAYLWWFLFGAFGGHRFYLGYYRSGLIILVITLFTLGLGAIIGWYDVVNIRRIAEKENKETILRLIKEVTRK